MLIQLNLSNLNSIEAIVIKLCDFFLKMFREHFSVLGIWSCDLAFLWQLCFHGVFFQIKSFLRLNLCFSEILDFIRILILKSSS